MKYISKQGLKIEFLISKTHF